MAAVVCCKRPHSLFEDDELSYYPNPKRHRGLLESAKEKPVPTVDPVKIEWAELLVKEMISATSLDDAKSRALKVVEVLEKSIGGRAFEEGRQSLGEENMRMKERVKELEKEGGVLRRGVSMQYKRLKEMEWKETELEEMKKLVAEYEDKLRKLEVETYGLKWHLNQALGSSIGIGSRHYHDRVF